MYLFQSRTELAVLTSVLGLKDFMAAARLGFLFLPAWIRAVYPRQFQLEMFQPAYGIIL